MMWRLMLLIVLIFVHCVLSTEVNNTADSQNHVAKNNIRNNSNPVEDGKSLSESTPVNSDGKVSIDRTSNEIKSDEVIPPEILAKDHSCDHSVLTRECIRLCTGRHLIPLCEVDDETCFCAKKQGSHYIRVLVLDLKTLVKKKKEERDHLGEESKHGQNEENTKEASDTVSSSGVGDSKDHENEVTALQVYSPEEAKASLRRFKRDTTTHGNVEENQNAKEKEPTKSEKEKIGTVEGEKKHEEAIAKKEDEKKHEVKVKENEKEQSQVDKKVPESQNENSKPEHSIKNTSNTESMHKEVSGASNTSKSNEEETSKIPPPTVLDSKETIETVRRTDEVPPSGKHYSLVSTTDTDTESDGSSFGKRLEESFKQNALEEEVTHNSESPMYSNVTEEELNKVFLNQIFIISAVLVYITLCALFLYVRSFRKRRYTRIPLTVTNEIGQV